MNSSFAWPNFTVKDTQQFELAGKCQDVRNRAPFERFMKAGSSVCECLDGGSGVMFEQTTVCMEYVYVMLLPLLLRK